MFPCASVSKRVFVRNLSCKDEFDYCEMNLWKSYEWFRIQTRFDTEAKCNSEIAIERMWKTHLNKKRRVKYREIKIFWSNVMPRF